MDIDFTTEEQWYKFITALKKSHPKTIGSAVLFNQQILTICGKIDAGLQKLSIKKRKHFIHDNKKFFDSFSWIYYQDWRESRAKSCAHLMDVYKLLNAQLTVENFIGETFYAGIPKVTVKEINAAVDKYNKSMVICEKIGIDGKLHPCSQNGIFPELTDFNDIYGDGTMITKQELDKTK